jgi:hypothetical protein
MNKITLFSSEYFHLGTLSPLVDPEQASRRDFAFEK